MIWDLEKYSDNIAVKHEGKQYTYAELSEISGGIAASTGGRCLVFVLSSNTPGSLAAYVGFLNNGIVPLMLDAEINRSLLDELVSTYRPRYMWMPADKAEDYAGFETVHEAEGYVMKKLEDENVYPLYEELALLIPTSGSTGSPKLVRQSYKNLIANTRSIIEYLEIDDTERAITTLPMNYVYGLSVLNTHLYAGARVVLTDATVYSKKFWDLFNEEKITSFAGVPFIYEMLHKLKVVQKNPLESLRYMTQAGGKLSPELQEIFSTYAAEKGKRFIVMYGASEATARMGYLPFEHALRKKGSMGVAIPGGRFELLDEEGQYITESGKTGELIYFGDNVTLGYALEGNDLAKGDENNGRLETGDMAYRDDEGFYYISGRKKRFLKILGKRTNLDETEGILKKELGIIDVACGGKDDELKIFITDESLKDKALDTAVSIIGINRALCKVKVIDEIPKNNSGKILYAQLNEM